MLGSILPRFFDRIICEEIGCLGDMDQAFDTDLKDT